MHLLRDGVGEAAVHVAEPHDPTDGVDGVLLHQVRARELQHDGDRLEVGKALGTRLLQRNDLAHP